MILYTAINVKQYSELLLTNKLPLLTLEEGVLGLEFTEDKLHLIEKIKNQEDLENIIEYKYAAVIEFEVKAEVLNSLIESKDTGRLGQKIIAYYKTINKPYTVPALKKVDTNVLCIMDIYESEETHDGISQKWMIKVDSENNDLWTVFSTNIHKISCIGAIPGSVEEAKRLMLKR